MKLVCNIKPRGDGTVVVRDMGKVYTFRPDEFGDLVCNVEEPALIARLLGLGDNYEPANVEDHTEAERLLREAEAERRRAAGEQLDEEGDDTLGGANGEQLDEEGDDTLDSGMEVVNGGLPIEANTPPKPTTPPPGSAAAKAAAKAGAKAAAEAAAAAAAA